MANIEPRSQKSVDKICEVCVRICKWTYLIVSILRNKQNANRTECKEGDLNSDFKTGKI